MTCQAFFWQGRCIRLKAKNVFFTNEGFIFTVVYLTYSRVFLTAFKCPEVVRATQRWEKQYICSHTAFPQHYSQMNGCQTWKGKNTKWLSSGIDYNPHSYTAQGIGNKPFNCCVKWSATDSHASAVRAYVANQFLQPISMVGSKTDLCAHVCLCSCM